MRSRVDDECASALALVLLEHLVGFSFRPAPRGAPVPLNAAKAKKGLTRPLKADFCGRCRNPKSALDIYPASIVRLDTAPSSDLAARSRGQSCTFCQQKAVGQHLLECPI